MKDLRIPFESIIPGDSVKMSILLILTTRKEKIYYRDKKVICTEDLLENLSLGKEKIFSVVFKQGKDVLLTGIDPGERTGIISYYREKVVFEEVAGSIKDTLSKVSELINNSLAKKKIIRIGDGNIRIVQILAEGLLNNLDNDVEVEIVDEKGTSNLIKQLDLKGPKDVRSAKIICFRKGKRYLGIK